MIFEFIAGFLFGDDDQSVLFWPQTVEQVFILADTCQEHCKKKGLYYAVGMDSKCGYPVGGLIDSTAIWVTADSCLCSRQALALLDSSFVCAVSFDLHGLQNLFSILACIAFSCLSDVFSDYSG